MPKAQAASIWPLRDGQDGAAKGLGHVGAVDEANGQHAGDEGVEIHALLVAPQLQQVVQADGAAVKNQQHHQQLRHAAHHGGVELGQPHQRPAARELGRRAQQPQQRGHGERGQRHAHGEQRALQDGQVVITHG